MKNFISWDGPDKEVNKRIKKIYDSCTTRPQLLLAIKYCKRLVDKECIWGICEFEEAYREHTKRQFL